MKTRSRLLKLCSIFMCVMMVMCFMPSMAFADGETDATTELPAAKEGVITLNSNVTLTAPYTVQEGETVTIDLNGNSITTNHGNALNEEHSEIKVLGKLTLIDSSTEKEGKIIAKGNLYRASIVVKDNGIFVMNSGHITGTTVGIAVFGRAQAIINGGKIDCDAYAITGNGSDTTQNTTITINNVEIETENSTSIYHPQPGTLNINGGTIEGATAIEMRTGELNVNGGKIVGTSNKFKEWNSNNGNTVFGVALGISKHVTKSPLNVNIYNGEFEGINAVYEGNHMSEVNGVQPAVTDTSINIYGGDFKTIKEGQEAVKSQNIKNFIYGGTFSTDPSAYVAPGYYSYNSSTSPAKWTVTYISSTPEPTDPITNHDETTAGEGQTETTPTTTADLSKDTASKTETKTETVTNEAGQTVEKTTQTTTVAPETAGKIVEKAVENKSEEVVLDATTEAAAEAGTQTQVVIPATTVQQIVEKTDAAVTVKTDAAEVTLDAKATEAIAEKVAESGAPAADETVAIVVEKAKESDTEVHFELSVVTSNGKVSDFKGGIVTVTVPVSKEMAAKELVCVYIAEDGTVTKVPGRLNADGTYTFTTGHFSTYAIMTVEEADKALDAQEAKLVDMVKAMKLKARSVKTSKGSIKVTAAAPAKTIKALKDAGYTVKYKFYRSTKKASKYAAKLQKTTNTYINTTGKKGVRYYYKAIVKVYDEDGKLVANTSLKNCRYACRVK